MGARWWTIGPAGVLFEMAVVGAAGASAQEPLYDLLVSSRATNSVKRYDGHTGAYVDDFVPPGSVGLSQTQEVLIKGSDILVVGIGTSAVLRFDRRGGPGSPFTSGYALNGPTKANWGPDGNLYVSQWGDTQSSVAVFDGATGAFIREATPDLDRPMDQAWDSEGTLYVLTFGSRDVRRYDETGNLIDIFVRPDEHLRGPVNLWFDEAGDLLIVDWTSGTIQKYSGTDGAHLAELVTGLTNPEGWDIGPDGRLYVGEWNVHRVRTVDLGTGDVGPNFTVGGGLGDPNGLAFVERLPDFAMSASATSATLSGGSAALLLSLTPLREVPFTDPIALGCSSSSTAVACTVSPTSVTLGDSAANVDVQLSSSASGARIPWVAAILLLLSCAARRKRMGTLGRVAVFFLVVSLAGCGKDPTGPGPGPTGNAVVTITAEAGALVRTVTIAVTGS